MVKIFHHILCAAAPIGPYARSNNVDKFCLRAHLFGFFHNAIAEVIGIHREH